MDIGEKLIEQLGQLDFSQYEARAYCALVQQSPMNGHEVSRAASIPPSKIYETLQRLHQKGAVLIYRSEPMLYAPVPYADLLARLRQQAEKTFQEVEQGLSQLTQKTETGLTWSLTGANYVVDALRRVIGRAQERIFAALWDEELPELTGALHEAHGRGVELHIATYGSIELDLPHTYDLRLCGASAQERLNGRRLCVLVADHNETVAAELTGSGQDQGIWTQNRVISLLATEYMKEEIMGRCLINALGEERYQRLRREMPALVSMLRPERT